MTVLVVKGEWVGERGVWGGGGGCYQLGRVLPG